MKMNVSKQSLSLFALILFCVTLVSCKGSSADVSTEEESTVLVQLFESGNEEALEVAFSDYDLKMKKVVSRPLYIGLYTFNTDKTTNTELVALLKKSPLVKEAQLNRNVELRN